MVTITIDNQRIAVDGRLTILEAAKTAHIEIPHLCYLKGINDIGACRICAVELEGKDRLVTACNTLVQEGMVIYTNSPTVRHARRCNVQLLLSQHDCECAYCSRSGNCGNNSTRPAADDCHITLQNRKFLLPHNHFCFAHFSFPFIIIHVF